ncbi:MAG: hypothetical protein OXC44_03495 [Proteobacteria bacterium]|nr:hypothetical protein [Pseudomonadota bacterium]
MIRFFQVSPKVVLCYVLSVFVLSGCGSSDSTNNNSKTDTGITDNEDTSGYVRLSKDKATEKADNTKSKSKPSDKTVASKKTDTTTDSAKKTDTTKATDTEDSEDSEKSEDSTKTTDASKGKAEPSVTAKKTDSGSGTGKVTPKKETAQKKTTTATSTETKTETVAVENTEFQCSQNNAKGLLDQYQYSVSVDGVIELYLYNIAIKRYDKEGYVEFVELRRSEFFLTRWLDPDRSTVREKDKIYTRDERNFNLELSSLSNDELVSCLMQNPEGSHNLFVERRDTPLFDATYTTRGNRVFRPLDFLKLDK